MWKFIKNLFKGKKQEPKQGVKEVEAKVAYEYPKVPLVKTELPVRPPRKPAAIKEVPRVSLREWMQHCREVDALLGY